TRSWSPEGPSPWCRCSPAPRWSPRDRTPAPAGRLPSPAMCRDSAELRFVDDDAGLRDLVRDLRDEPRVAVDTESDSMHAYFEKVCVVQVSAPGRDYVIDA